MRYTIKEAGGPMLALFATTSTLLCCALPALLVSIGAGAVMAGLAGNIPGLVWLSERKEAAFLVAGLLLVASAAFKWLTRNDPCPADTDLGRACTRLRRWGTVMLAIAFLTYGVGGFFAFFAADLLL
jgi:hypothetical protein